MLGSARGLDEEVGAADVLVEVRATTLDHQLDPLARFWRRRGRARVNLAVHLEHRVVLHGRARVGRRVPDKMGGQSYAAAAEVARQRAPVWRNAAAVELERDRARQRQRYGCEHGPPEHMDEGAAAAC